MSQKQEQIYLGIIGLLILIISILGGWYLTRSNISLLPSSDPVAQNLPREETTLPSVESFSVPEGPSIRDTPLVNAPNYIYLFTHTEDPFNHELSEDRWWRVGSMLESIASTFPSSNISWTIEFMGSDAKTISDRNPETGTVDYLLSLKEQGLVEFGYHAHHDPTYMNRPQNSLSTSPSYEETYEALWSWITCEKDPLYGGCVAERGGGLEAVLSAFGEVEIVTGLGIGTGVQYERSAGSQAVRELLPNRWLGFGIPDHGAVASNKEITTAKLSLMELLTPTHETSSSTFWMDNAIRINDDAPLENLNINKLTEGARLVEASLSSLDGTRPHVLNAGIADKFLYSVDKTSPTVWGYAHPESPELPSISIKPTKDIEKGYKLTQEALEYLAQLVSNDSTKSFVDSQDVVDLFTSEDYWNVTEEELKQMALWILNEWGNTPPNLVYDGEDFYSLSDAFALLHEGLQGSYPAEGIVSMVYGPWSLKKNSSSEIEISTEDFSTLLRGNLYTDNQIQETYKVGNQTLTSTQVLYAMSYLFVLGQEGVSMDRITIPQTQSAPLTYGILEDLGCTDCLDTAWSLKPARFQD
ncbi:hypothetical protein COV05_01205 [Candidatus Uhrbacteria bacterium CG10_big_fil_rev_8_21_14_0_10_48_16]|uniref:Uncharacterized protein n=1 Tax=Candidatus Uhrbacteria bacterium CG10_big_fil_rev_8_21_14_0_10_48_16 TaxID=1975038 RepID=A0A2M8LHW1_9BACT|nr:MAG: hypothetical protein COV05_01205 [Candidatus Uhrbacteria bacterium CG10_big_fil_rev_8_21_14_0_10_48_16]